MSLRNELGRAIRDRKYEKSENGIFVPRANIEIGGVFGHAVNGKDWMFDHNLVCDEGLDHVLDVAFSSATQITTWYIGIFEGSGYVPAADDDASNIKSRTTELEASEYDEANRVTWTEAGVSSKSITNSASKADFTMASTETVYGGFLISNNTKGGTSGTLMAASNFDVARSVVATDVLSVTYTLTIADA